MAQSESPRDDVYKALPDADAEVRGSRQSLSKPREKSDDGASEKLLSKEIEARIVTQENMADAKYVVGDIRNGDAKVEIDSNKRTFTGLSKEELLKYQDDPFWVRLRWTMFVLFWALWVGMLVGAIAIIVQSPKCTAPQARKWYEEGPLVELEEASSFHTIEEGLPRLKEAHVKGVYVPSTLAGDIYDEKLNLTAFQEFVQKAKDAGVKVIVDMTANFVNKSHEWFALSERSEGEYADYFMWAPAKRQDAGQNQPPNNWVSTLDEPAWTWSEQRKAFYLHQYSADTPDLNFSNPRVQDIFYGVMRTWLNAGAAGIRLQKARQLLVNRDLPDDNIGPDGTAYAHTEYAYYSHRPTSDRPELRALLQRWRKATEELDSDFVLSMRESVPAREPYLARDVMDGNRTTSALPLPAAGAVSVTESAQRLSTHLNRLIRYWPAVQLTSDSETADEAALLSLMLPAAPILTRDQKFTVDNTTWKVNPTYEHMVGLRSQPVIMHGHYNITSFAHGTLLGITRWMSGGAGYAAVYNPSAATVLGDATELPHVPDAVAVEMLSRNYDVPNITRHSNVHGRDLVVSPRSVIVLVFVPVADE